MWFLHLLRGLLHFPFDATDVDVMHSSPTVEVEAVAPESPTVEVEATTPKSGPNPCFLGYFCCLGPCLEEIRAPIQLGPCTRRDFERER